MNKYVYLNMNTLSDVSMKVIMTTNMHTIGQIIINEIIISNIPSALSFLSLEHIVIAADIAAAIAPKIVIINIVIIAVSKEKNTNLVTPLNTG